MKGTHARNRSLPFFRINLAFMLKEKQSKRSFPKNIICILRMRPTKSCCFVMPYPRTTTRNMYWQRLPGISVKRLLQSSKRIRISFRGSISRKTVSANMWTANIFLILSVTPAKFLRKSTIPCLRKMKNIRWMMWLENPGLNRWWISNCREVKGKNLFILTIWDGLRRWFRKWTLPLETISIFLLTQSYRRQSTAC